MQYYFLKDICEIYPLTGYDLFFIVVLNSVLWICHKLLYKWTFDLFPGSRISCCYNWCRCNLVAYVCNSNIPEVNARGPEFSVNLKSIVSLENPISKTKWHISSKSTAGVSIPGHASWFPFSFIWVELVPSVTICFPSGGCSWHNHEDTSCCPESSPPLDMKSTFHFSQCGDYVMNDVILWF